MVITADIYIYVVIAGLSITGVAPDRLAAAIAAEAGQALQRHEEIVRQHGVNATASDMNELARRAGAVLASQRQAGDLTVCHRVKPVCLTIEQ